MFKLAMNPRFRDGAKKVVAELQNAGIDKVNCRVPPLAFHPDSPSRHPPQEAMEELTDLSRWSKK